MCPPPLQDYKTWLQWAVLERRLGHFDAAERCFTRGVEVAPYYPHLWCVLPGTTPSYPHPSYPSYPYHPHVW